MSYHDFINSKEIKFKSCGIPSDYVSDINNNLFQYQKDIVLWSLRIGKSAVWADCGLGKTLIEMEWSKQVHLHTGKPTIILAPLSVSKQTIEEGKKFGYNINLCETQEDVIDGINITNYEKIHKFDCSVFSGVVLDESSILKSFSSKTKNLLIEKFYDTDFRLACSATPAPNDYTELGNHAEFLGIMSYNEMLSMFFINDLKDTTASWRLKKHAVGDFWKWICSWAIYIQNPSDFGYNDCNFTLPELKIHDEVIDLDFSGKKAIGMNEARKARRETIDARCKHAAKIAKILIDSGEQVLIWCDLNEESKKLIELINEAVEISGANTNEEKENRMMDFSHGKIKCLVTKPKIAGFGMNWQNCNKMIFVGIGYSYEQYYQAVRRCWRFGQNKTVDVYVVTTQREGSVVESLKNKENNAISMINVIREHMDIFTMDNIHQTSQNITKYNPQIEMIIPPFLL